MPPKVLDSAKIMDLKYRGRGYTSMGRKFKLFFLCWFINNTDNVKGNVKNRDERFTEKYTKQKILVKSKLFW